MVFGGGGGGGGGLGIYHFKICQTNIRVSLVGIP